MVWPGLATKKQTSDLPAVRLAVLFGLAAKLTQSSDIVKVDQVWHALAHKRFESRIRTLEVQVVNAFGREGLGTQLL